MEMALFNKRPAPREVHAPIEAGSYLGQGSKVTGKLNFEGPARIDGQIDGEIIAKDSIMIGESAVVSGPIKAASVIVAGKVSGDIIASQRIELRFSAKVLGNLTSNVLIVHEALGSKAIVRCSPRGRARSAKSWCFPRSVRWPRPEVRSRLRATAGTVLTAFHVARLWHPQRIVGRPAYLSWASACVCTSVE
jgi:cytoskeletal protein CcmA (bactofilin family)